MKMKFAMTAIALVSSVALTNAFAEESKASVAPTMSTGARAETEAKAVVKAIDYKTRKVTLKGMDTGEEFSFVAGDKVKNLNQVKKGDIVTANYSEAVVYDIKKGSHAIGVGAKTTTKSARPGSQPQGTIEREVTASVMISAIDKKAPSVTFKNAEGDTKTIKVRDPARLEGVKVGDTVEITYTEALALRVDKATKQ